MIQVPRSFKSVAAPLILGALALGGGCTTGGARRLEAPPNGRMPVAVENLNEGRFRLVRAGHRLVLDLAREIAGCTSGTYDHTVNEKYAPSVDLEIVDETEQGAYTYLLLLASAPGNCNIQGHCGAGGSDSTLLWLKVTRKLSLAAKQAFVIEDCRADLTADVPSETDPEKYDFGTIRAKDLTWNGDLLQVDYQDGYESPTRRVVYDRSAPDSGLRRMQ